MEKGLNIKGIDLSSEMLEKLKEKRKDAKVVRGDIIGYVFEENLITYLFLQVQFRYLQI